MSTECEGCPACAPLRAELAAKEQRIAELIETLTRHDALTGTLNRRSLTELVAEELQRSSRTGQPFCFALIGVDQLKEINAAFGHDAGDAVLQAIAKQAGGILRTLDRFGRMEGDEFGVILPATWLHQGSMAVDRLRAVAAGFDWSAITPGRSVTFCTGLTTNAPAESAENMIKRAEDALRQAKAAGSDQVAQLEQALPDSLFAAMDD